MRGFSPTLILTKQIHSLYRAELEQVCAHPRFIEAVRDHARLNRNVLSDEKDPYFAKYIGDLGNLLIESAALYFHLLKTHENFGAGATLGKIQLVAFAHGFASPRRVTMYVKRMVQIERLSYSDDAADKRVRRLIPGNSLILTARKHIAGLLNAVDHIWPGSNYAKRTIEDREFFYEMFLQTGYLYLQGCDPLRPFSDVRHFTSKDAGTFILSHLAFACLEGETGLRADKIFSISYSEIAQSAGVSRTHVRNVFEAAEARGLITGLGDGGRSMRLTDQMIKSYSHYYACLLILARTAAALTSEKQAARK
ncbi:MAG: hypothetical protein ABL897_08300 [Hyphomicrobium sp.]